MHGRNRVIDYPSNVCGDRLPVCSLPTVVATGLTEVVPSDGSTMVCAGWLAPPVCLLHSSKSRLMFTGGGALETGVAIRAPALVWGVLLRTVSGLLIGALVRSAPMSRYCL